MNRPLTYKEFANLNDEYIFKKLKQGKSTEQIKNEYAIENNLLNRMYGNSRAGEKNKFASAFETNLYIKIKKNKELNTLNNTIKNNQDINLNSKRLKKFYKDNISNYTDTRGTIKKGTVENLNQDALKFFKKNYPGSVSTYLAKKGGSGRLSPNTEYIRIASGPGATGNSVSRGRQMIREEMEKYMPSSVGGTKKSKNKFKRLQRSEQTGAESLGMTRNQYRSLINKLVVYPVRKLFPSLISTPYVAGAEHVYGLQQAISTNMIGEIKKSALNVVPGPRDFNRLIKGPKLDQFATGLIKNAYQTADVEKKQMYLDKANKLIDDFKKDFPGDYPKYKLTSKNNIVDVNISRVNKIKEPLFNKASTYIDYLVKTPGFLESNEFSNLPDTAKEIINAKVSKSKSFTNLLKAGIRKGGALAIPAAVAYQALSPSTAEAKVLTPTKNTQTATRDVQVAELDQQYEDDPRAVNQYASASMSDVSYQNNIQPQRTPITEVADASSAAKLADDLVYDSVRKIFVKRNEPEVKANQSDLLYWLADNVITESPIASIGVGTAGLSIPGAKETFEAARKADKGILKSSLSVLGKGLTRVGSPAGTALFEIPFIAEQIQEGKSPYEILSDPLNYIGPAFTESLTKSAGAIKGPSKGFLGGVKDTLTFEGVRNPRKAAPGLLNLALRLGLSPRNIALISGTGAIGAIGATALTAYDLIDAYGKGELDNLFSSEEGDTSDGVFLPGKLDTTGIMGLKNET
jgi:hypothetical protein